MEGVGRLLGISRLDLIEKDIILHGLLRSFSIDKDFPDELIFKGGTCLIKSYLGYYRFSEDLDFTWGDQSQFEGKTLGGIRKVLSPLIDGIGGHLVDICKTRGFDFTFNKGDRKYMEFGGGGKTTTFKLWYESEIMKHPSFVKIQINFVEMLLYPSHQRELNGLLIGGELEGLEDLERFFPEEFKGYSDRLRYGCYDVLEILVEKFRSILTRRGVKARDFLDIFLLSEKYGTDVHALKGDIIRKTNFVLEQYEKYAKNLELKKGLIRNGSIFEWGAERDLLISGIDEDVFYDSVKRNIEFLAEIIKGSYE